MTKKTEYHYNPLAPLSGIVANSSIGQPGEVLVSNGTGVYWSNSVPTTIPGMGYTGSLGFTGSQGATGFTGSSGFTGSRGFTGSQGTVGFTGSFGYTGSQGATGFTGSQGAGGFTGSQGAVGFTGSTGFTGSSGGTGFTGSQGAVGFTGSSGSTGFTGSQGTVGFTGSFGFTGSRGTTGFTGSFGFTGSQGATGFTGSQGTNGFDGSFGFTGSQGTVGYTGSFGFTGSQGATGFTGSQGTLGFTGSFGYTGSRGATGFDGSFGFTGSRGTTGFTGSQGANGFDGSFGFTGSRGTTGFTGSFGFTGSQGSVGFTGSFGFTGSRGTTGFDGSFGFTGSQGSVGFTGSQGAVGFTGSFGFTGSQGAVGFTGSRGTTGFDGSFGYTGSIGAVGFTGSFGYTGSIGAVGFTGSFGFTGSRGTTGFTGSFGFTGSQGTVGFTGSQGTNGFDGSVGFTGSRGATGFAGSFGFTGSLGTVGFTGSFGFTGSQGTVGFTGSQGSVGFDGSFGFTGSRGTTGFTGSFGYTGSQGTTGFTGSFGFTGSQGTTGFTGSFGFTGSQGSVGFTGSRGFTGSLGPTGTSGLGNAVNTQILFDDSDTANGVSSFTFNKTTNTVVVGNASNIYTVLSPTFIGGNSVAYLGNTYVFGEVNASANITGSNFHALSSIYMETNARYIYGTLSDGTTQTRLAGVSTANTIFIGAIDQSVTNAISQIRVNAPANAAVDVYSNGTFHTRFAANGNLGVNTLTPTYQLDVVGTTRVTGDIIVTGNSTLGTTAADSITINAGTATLTTNLNIDSSLLYIDTLNNRIGMGIIPATLVHASGNSTTSIVRLTSNAIGLAAFDGSGPGIELTAGGMNTTNKYTPAIKFGSEDPEFTTTNPKFGASIIAEASQSYTLDTTGGMHLTFWTAPANPGTGHGLVENMRISSNGNVGVGTIAPIYKFDVTGDIRTTANAVIGRALIANSSSGTAGQVLTSNSTGIYWSTVTGGGGSTTIFNDDVSAGPVYPLFYTGTGTTSTLYQSNSSLMYYPSTGALESKIFRASSPGTGDPTAAAGDIIYGARTTANRIMPIVREPSGITYPLQGHFSRKNIRSWRFGAGTAATTLAATIGAISITSSGTITLGVPSVANPYTRSLVSTGTTAGTVINTRCATTNIGAVVAGTRWHYSAVFGVNTFSTLQASVNAFVGLFDVNTAPAAFTPTTSTTNGKLGMGFSGTANEWQVINNVAGTAPTLSALTSGSGRYSITNTIKFQLDMWSDGTNYYWQVAAIDSGSILDINSGTFSTNRPASGTLIYPLFYATNGAVAAAQIMEYMHMTLETDIA